MSLILKFFSIQFIFNQKMCFYLKEIAYLIKSDKFYLLTFIYIFFIYLLKNNNILIN